MNDIFIDKDKGEMLCSLCKGSRLIEEEVGKTPDDDRKIPIKNLCPKCLGTGKVDWIENATGKSHNSFDTVITLNEPVDFIEISYCIDKDGVKFIK